MPQDTFAGAVWERLAASSAVTSKVASYGGQPALFTADRIPEQAALPAVVVKSPADDLAEDTKTSQHRTVIVYVDCWADAKGSTLGVDRLALAVRDALHRAPVSLTGYTGWRAEVAGPEIVPSDERVYSRRCVVSLSFNRA